MSLCGVRHPGAESFVGECLRVCARHEGGRLGSQCAPGVALRLRRRLGRPAANKNTPLARWPGGPEYRSVFPQLGALVSFCVTSVLLVPVSREQTSPSAMLGSVASLNCLPHLSHGKWGGPALF